MASGDLSAPFGAAVDITQHTVDALYVGPLAHRPDEGIIVWVYTTKAADDEGLQRHAPMAETYGDDPHAQ